MRYQDVTFQSRTSHLSFTRLDYSKLLSTEASLTITPSPWLFNSFSISPPLINIHMVFLFHCLSLSNQSNFLLSSLGAWESVWILLPLLPVTELTTVSRVYSLHLPSQPPTQKTKLKTLRIQWRIWRQQFSTIRTIPVQGAAEAETSSTSSMTAWTAQIHQTPALAVTLLILKFSLTSS